MGGKIRYICDYYEVEEVCPKCGERFSCIYSEQTPGFRFEEVKVCPYCKEVLETSMTYEFITSRL